MQSYLSRFPGYFDLSDLGRIDDDGYVFVLGRSDDVLVIAGHNLSTGGMEEVISQHSSVAETAVVGLSDSLKGSVPIGFVVLKAGVDPAKQVEIATEIRSSVREGVGAVCCYQHTFFVDRLPKTRSGKVLRRTLKSIANREEFTVPATIEDPSVLDSIQKLFGKSVARL